LALRAASRALGPSEQQLRAGHALVLHGRATPHGPADRAVEVASSSRARAVLGEPLAVPRAADGGAADAAEVALRLGLRLRQQKHLRLQRRLLLRQLLLRRLQRRQPLGVEDNARRLAGRYRRLWHRPVASREARRRDRGARQVRPGVMVHRRAAVQGPAGPHGASRAQAVLGEPLAVPCAAHGGAADAADAALERGLRLHQQIHLRLQRRLLLRRLQRRLLAGVERCAWRLAGWYRRLWHRPVAGREARLRHW